MRHRILIALSAALALASCGSNGSGNGSSGATASAAPVHRKPGSWSTKIEVPKLEGTFEGKQVKPGDREQLQQIFGMFSGMAVCVTPELAAQEDISKNLEQSAGSSDCKFDKHEVNGGAVDFSGVCDKGASKIRMTAHGTSSETAQDFAMRIEPLDPAGQPQGVMEMHISYTYNGACKPGDLTPPPPAKGGAKP
jgi:hypothetical protein